MMVFFGFRYDRPMNMNLNWNQVGQTQGILHEEERVLYTDMSTLRTERLVSFQCFSYLLYDCFHGLHEV